MFSTVYNNDFLNVIPAYFDINNSEAHSTLDTLLAEKTSEKDIQLEKEYLNYLFHFNKELSHISCK